MKTALRRLGGWWWRLPLSNQLRYDVNGDGEDDGAVFLRRDVVEGLQVTKLHGTHFRLLLFPG